MFYILKLIKPITLQIFGIDDAIIGGVGAGLFSGLGSFFGGTETAKTSAAAARENTAKQIAWERERATNAHQWEIADLEKAGLNKVLTTNGSGATTSGITPQMPDTTGIKEAYSGIGNILLNAVNSAQQIQRTSEEISQIKAQTANLDADSNLKGLQAITESYRKGLITAHTAQLLSQAEINKLKYKSDKRWLDWERGSNVFKNISMPILTAIGTLGSLTKLKDIGRIMDKMSKKGSNGNIYNYYNNFSKLDL